MASELLSDPLLPSTGYNGKKTFVGEGDCVSFVTFFTHDAFASVCIANDTIR